MFSFNLYTRKHSLAPKRNLYKKMKVFIQHASYKIRFRTIAGKPGLGIYGQAVLAPPIGLYL